MPSAVSQLLVAGAVTLAIWVLGGLHWTLLVIGAVLALSLWVMLFAGSYARPDRGRVATRDYATSAALAVALGYVFTLIGDGAVWWAVGFIMAGAIIPGFTGASSRGADER